MAVLVLSESIQSDPWLSAVIQSLKDHQSAFDLRVWPDSGNPKDIEIVLAWCPTLGGMKYFPNLKLIISLGAGVEHILKDPQLPENIPIVRLADPEKAMQMAEYVSLAVLSFKRRLIDYQKLQRSQRWAQLPIPDNDLFSVGILGLGHLGKTVSQQLVSLNISVRGWSRSLKSIPGVECFYGREQFSTFLSQCQVIVCLLPLTPETMGILNESTFSALPKEAYLINVGRGAHLVELDLLEALESGQLAGACLDVFDSEPLPAKHPFWTHPNIILTPHIAAEGSPHSAAEFVVDIISKYDVGAKLQYLVDRDRGY